VLPLEPAGQRPTKQESAILARGQNAESAIGFRAESAAAVSKSRVRDGWLKELILTFETQSEALFCAGDAQTWSKDGNAFRDRGLHQIIIERRDRQAEPFGQVEIGGIVRRELVALGDGVQPGKVGDLGRLRDAEIKIRKEG